MKSPVQLTNYRIKKLNFEIVKDFDDFDLGNASFTIDVDYNLYSDEEDPLNYKVHLFVNVNPAVEEKMFLPHEIEIVLQGVFLFEKELEEQETAYHLNVSCPSMLYGVARNMIHQLTGQTNYGPITIPSVQFSKIAERKQNEASDNTESPNPK